MATDWTELVEDVLGQGLSGFLAVFWVLIWIKFGLWFAGVLGLTG